jgi:DUF1009 family protein
MAITKAALFKELLPGLTKLFNDEYARHKFPDTYHIIKKNHKYQVWLCGKVRKKLVAKNIQPRREALAVIKLLKATQEN